ncbi:hypothetical protein QFC21_006167 [Naganishia friedmannii]|uniref:Uncharacterized protein n=1 Tax=Naganishia friedmannii TaxID=89922 RepID=A0ACC2V5E0_9TREE|nr:hypothetical protein QFC21_006167 [Naganishia friedmannii]
MHSLKLNTGHEIPVLGMGCWMGKKTDTQDNPETYEMVKKCLKVGYRHLDTAYGYGNEQAVGKAVRDSGIAREEIFVTTKLTNEHHGCVEKGFQSSLKALGIEYIDLYLMHWPQANDEETGETIPYGESPTFVETWKNMEKLLDTGKVKSIGVKNLKVLLKEAKIVPAVNQVEAHPYLPEASLSAFCKSKGIVMTAYSPLGQPHGANMSPVLTDPLVKRLAEKYSKPAGTVLLSWLIQRGNWTAVPKTATESRMKDNLAIFEIDEEDFDALSKVHEEEGKLLHLCDYGQGDITKTPKIFGWSLEDMGWDHLD